MGAVCAGFSKMTPWAAAIEADFRTASLGERRVALLDYAKKLTLTPAEIEESDIEHLRTVGLSDRDILHLVEVIAYFAYANRIADGLGVTLEPWVDHAN